MKKLDLLVFEGDKESARAYRLHAHEEQIYPVLASDPAPEKFPLEPDYHVLLGCTLNLLYKLGKLKVNCFRAQVYVRDDLMAVDVSRHGMELVQWLRSTYSGIVPTLGCGFVTPWWIATRLEAEGVVLKTEAEGTYHVAKVEFPRDTIDETEMLVVRRRAGPVMFLADVPDFAGRIEFRVGRKGRPEKIKHFLRSRDSIPDRGEG
jgi:hypothetical protein